MIEKQRIEEVEEKEVVQPEIKLVDGYPPAYKKRLAQLDQYKKIIHDVLQTVKSRAIDYPVVIWDVLKSGSEFAWGCSRECMRSLVDGQLYPLSFRIDGQVVRDLFVGRLIASILVSAVYGLSFLFKSKTFVSFICFILALFAVFGFFDYMGVAEQMQQDSKLWNMWSMPSIVFNSMYFIVPLGVMGVAFGYLGYKKSQHYRGLKPSWDSFIDGVIGNKETKKRDCE